MNLIIDFIYVNYHSEKYLINSIDSLNRHYKSTADNIIIIDNSPSSWNYNTFKEGYFEVIKSTSNLGFAKANNIGAVRSDSKYLCFINPDTILVEDCISPIIDYMEKDKNVGVCAPMLVNNNLHYQNSSGFQMGFWFEFFESFFLMRIYRALKGMLLKSKIESLNPVKVDWLSGAFMIVKRDAFQSVNGFTEDFFLNYEDIDLCRKLQIKGYRNYYFPFLKCIHLDHASFKGAEDVLVFSRYQSKLLYSKLYYNPIKALIIRLINIVGIIIRIFGSLIVFDKAYRERRYNGYFSSLKLYLSIKHK